MKYREHLLNRQTGYYRLLNPHKHPLKLHVEEWRTSPYYLYYRIFFFNTSYTHYSIYHNPLELELERIVRISSKRLRNESLRVHTSL